MDFLEKVRKVNPNLIRAAAALHQSGMIPAETYVLDLDAISANSELLREVSRRNDIDVYFCLKQIARNPLAGQAVMNAGLKKAMAMTVEGAKSLDRHGIPVGHVGHMGQLPQSDIRYVLEKIRPEVVTVFSVEKAREISKVASKLKIKQNLLLKIVTNPYQEAEYLTRGTAAGFTEAEAIRAAKVINELDGVAIVGGTTYSALEFSLLTKEHFVSENFRTLVRTARRLEKEAGVDVQQINAPGESSVETAEMLAKNGATHMEPGHSLTGTLPYNAIVEDTPEIPGLVFVSEISHFYQGYPLAYGESYMTTSTIGSLRSESMGEYVNACVGSDPDQLFNNMMPARPQSYQHHDTTWYMYAALLPGQENAKVKVSDTVVMSFRPQIYRTSSARVAVLSGVRRGKPKLLGLFDRSGIMLDRDTDSPLGYDASRVTKIMASIR
jgi:predicted amino acid racemase